MNKLFNCLSVVALLVLTACGGATYITPDKESVNFALDGGEDIVKIDADGSWDIEECPDWVTTDTQDNILVIKTAKNETGAIREGDIVLKGKSDVEVTIKVTQATKCTHITPDSDSVEFEKEGGTKTVNIDTDGMLQVEASEGFTASFDNGVLTVTAPANDGGAKRGEIKLSGDDQSVTIFATQSGNECQRCGGSGKITCSKCSGKGYVGEYTPADGYMPAYTYTVGCRKCGGYGYLEGDNYRRGSGQVTCPTCGGSGH